MQQIWKKIRPVFASALFLLVTTLLFQCIGKSFFNSFYILANRGPEKILFTLLFMFSAALCMWLTGAASFKTWQKKNFAWLRHTHWLTDFFTLFFIFFTVHIITLITCVIHNYAIFSASGFASINCLWFVRVAFGFLATLFLVFSEELLFRGTLYTVIATYCSPHASILITSICFSLSHNLQSPLTLVTTEWQLGLGLFLLGVLLNLIYVITGNLYTAMGAHGGLVFVKVILRRLPIIQFAPHATTGLLFNTDLRQSLVIHIALTITSLLLIFLYYKKIERNVL